MERKPITIAPGFTIDKDGNVFDPSGNKRNTYRNGDRYVTVAIKLACGLWTTVGVHRLVALAYLDKPSIAHCEVNHRDGDLENNKMENLEWVTHSQNNIHSEVTRRDNKYPTITIGFVGKPPYAAARNVWNASELTGVPPLDIWDAVRDDKPVNGFEFKHRPFDGRIPKEMHKTRIVNRGVDGRSEVRPVKVFNIRTGETEHFESMSEAARVLQTTASHLHQSIAHHGDPRFFRKKYQVAYAGDEFPILSEVDLIVAQQRGARAVIAYNRERNQRIIYPSAKSFIMENGLSKKTVTTCLAKGVTRDVDGWVFGYLDIHERDEAKKKSFYGGSSLHKSFLK